MSIRMAGGGGGGVQGWPLTFYGFGHQSDDGSSNAIANQLIYYGFVLPAQLTFTHLVAWISTADAINNSDIGIYDAAGATLLANIGAQTLASTGVHAFPIVQTSVTLAPGKYVFAVTSAGSTLEIVADSSIPSWAANVSGTGTSSGGALPASFTVTPNYINTNYGWFFALYS